MGIKNQVDFCPLENRRSGSTYINPLPISLCCFWLFVLGCFLCRSAFILFLALVFVLAIPRAELYIRPCGSKGLSAIFTDTFPASAFCRFLPIVFCSTVWTAKERVGAFGIKILATTFTSQFERLSNSVFTSLDFLIPFTALDSMPF